METDTCACRHWPRSGSASTWTLLVRRTSWSNIRSTNLSDADFVNSIPAVTQVQVLLQQIAPNFGYDPADTSRYNNFFRNVVLAYLSPERLMMIYDKGGLEEVVDEVSRLRRLHVI
jgi:hypothetical protein